MASDVAMNNPVENSSVANTNSTCPYVTEKLFTWQHYQVRSPKNYALSILVNQ